jgi:hypothetical protein
MPSKQSRTLSGAEFDKFKAECTVRSKAFRREVLAYHKRYPTVFVVSRRSPQSLPKWFVSIVERRGDVVVARPRRFRDVQALSGMEAQVEYVKCGLARLRPDDGPAYFRALDDAQRDVARWRQDRSVLAGRWPWVPLDALEAPGSIAVAGLKRPVIVFNQSLGGFAIPLYSDWTKRDFIDVYHLLRRVGLLPKRRARRPRRDVACLLLDVFDAVELHGSVSKASAILGISKPRATRLYERACLEIERRPPRRSGETPTAAEISRRLAEVHSAAEHCSACRELELLCPTHAQLVEDIPLGPGRLGQAHSLTESGNIEARGNRHQMRARGNRNEVESAVLELVAARTGRGPIS